MLKSISEEKKEKRVQRRNNNIKRRNNDVISKFETCFYRKTSDLLRLKQFSAGVEILRIILKPQGGAIV